MHSIRTFGLLTALGFFAAAPVLAQDDDAATLPATDTDDAVTTPTANVDDQCIDQCVDGCADKCAAGVNTTKKSKSSSRSMGAPANGRTAASGTTINNNVSGNVDLDSIRSEERARAAEEFRAENERMMGEHQAELDRVRSEERDLASKKAEADIAAARAEEDRKYRNEILKRDQQISMAAREEPVIKPAVLTPVGVYGFVGGGVTNFTEPEATGATSVGGFWDARLGIGTRSIIGGEIAYVGGARDVDALGLNSSAFLVNNGVEGVARLNVPITTRNVLIEPYTFGGIGWQHYNLASETTNTSDVNDDDDIMTVPMGLGLQLGFSGFTIDARATYRHAFFSDLVGNSTSSFDSESLNSWGAGAALGFEF